MFKLDALEPQCEDYGQAVIYQGTIPEHGKVFELDAHHAIEAGRVFPVCGNTWMMLCDTRFAPHFDFIGNFAKHFGVFPGCGSAVPFGQSDANPAKAEAPCC